MTNSIRIPWWRTYFGQEEIAEIVDALKHEHVSQGPVTAKLEIEAAQALGVPFAVATTGCTMALTMAYMALGVKAGDEVIIPNRTFIATAHAAKILGAKVVLVDTLQDLPLLDTSKLEQCISSKTKVIVPVHLNGRSVDMQALLAIAAKHNIAVVEDAAQAAFSKNSDGYLGTQSDIGCYSLGMSKLFSSGQGGILVTKSKELYEKLLLIRNQGVTDVFQAQFELQGFNCKFTDIQAALGRVQLRRVPDKIDHLLRIQKLYEEGIKDLPFIKLLPVNTQAGEVPLWVEVLVENRSALQDYLSNLGIETRRFLPNLNLSKHLENHGEFPASKIFDEQGLFLPGGPSQPLENAQEVIAALRKWS